MADAEHQVSVCEIGELGYARTAPGCPKTDQKRLLAGIGAQRLQVGGSRHLQLHGLRLNLPQALDPRRRFLMPLRRATENSGVFHSDFLMRHYRVYRIAGILRLHPLYPVAVVKAPFGPQTMFG